MGRGITGTWVGLWKGMQETDAVRSNVLGRWGGPKGVGKRDGDLPPGPGKQPNIHANPAKRGFERVTSVFHQTRWYNRQRPVETRVPAHTGNPPVTWR
jgi:hypothetical protein